MGACDRREFLCAVAATAAAVNRLRAEEPKIPRLGMYLSIRQDADAMMAKARELGFTLCEVYTGDIEPAAESKLGEAIKRHRMEVTALFTMGPGAQKWDFYEGPITNGLVPREHRHERIDHLKKASDVAKRLNIPAVETHVGYIPENPNDVLYGETVEAVREVAGYCRANGQTFLYHAGQETPTTLLRAIHDVGLD